MNISLFNSQNYLSRYFPDFTDKAPFLRHREVKQPVGVTQLGSSEAQYIPKQFGFRVPSFNHHTVLPHILK